MKNKLDDILAKRTKPLFMAHALAGYPTVPDSLTVAEALLAGGADILELQIPFSDPLADGPTIMEACTVALERGAKVHDVFHIAEKLMEKTDAPILIMSYINPVFRYGIAAFVADAKRFGISGLIIPDAPFDSPEGLLLLEETQKHGLHLIAVISPGISGERLTVLAKNARGFVYCTSRQGITGVGTFAQDLPTYLTHVRALFGIPIALGFGIKTREDFLAAATIADVVIAGSVFVDIIKDTENVTMAIRESVQKLISDPP